MAAVARQEVPKPRLGALGQFSDANLDPHRLDHAAIGSIRQKVQAWRRLYKMR